MSNIKKRIKTVEITSIKRKKGENNIIPDPERFSLVRKMWDMMLTGAYTN